eukprot:12926493-Prorocentrum_lima.AAC.1
MQPAKSVSADMYAAERRLDHLTKTLASRTEWSLGKQPACVGPGHKTMSISSRWRQGMKLP